MTISERQERRRKEIAIAVRDFMKNSDFDNITVDDICNATGIAKGTFYHYFEGKDSLLDEVLYPIDDYFASFEEELLGCDSFLEAISQYAEYYSTYISESGLKMCRTVILAMMSANNKTYVSDDRVIKNILIKIISQWQEKGEVTKDFIAERICSMFLVIFRGYMLNWYSENGSYDLGKEVSEQVRLLALSLQRK
jgi:AcrR family transcriptional regulator